jgi:hypothetical protein
MATADPAARAKLERAIDEIDEEFRDLPPRERKEALKELGALIFREHLKNRRKPGLRSERLAGPGATMLRVACLLFPKRKVVRVFLPLISDYELEFAAARREGSPVPPRRMAAA